MIIGMLILRAIPLVGTISSWPNAYRIPHWTTILAFGIVGVLGVFLAPKAGFPEIGSSKITVVQRVVIPSVLGLGVGVISIFIDTILHLDYAIEIDLPTSLIAYPLDGILEEIQLRLLLTTFLVWLLSTMILKGKFQEHVFWAIAGIVAVAYTWWQIVVYTQFAGAVDTDTVVRFVVLTGAYFLVAAFVYRRFGFLAVVVMRLAQYLLWHILWKLAVSGIGY
jgi:hypothetical protein